MAQPANAESAPTPKNPLMTSRRLTPDWGRFFFDFLCIADRILIHLRNAATALHQGD